MHSRKKLVVHALVLVGLVGGTAAYVGFDKKVTLTVDGHKRQLHTFAHTVGDLLASQHLKVSEHDTLAPAADTELSDGREVVVRYGRLLHLNLDGKQREIWVTATSVDEALGQLNVRADGAYLSASRSQPIGRTGLELLVRTARDVTVLVDGQSRAIRTTEPTVAQMLEKAGIHLGKYDQVSAPLQQWPEPGQVVTVIRVTGKVVQREEQVPFDTKKIQDSSHYKGWSDVVTKGVKGLQMVTYEQKTTGGRTTKRVLSRKVLKKPVTEVRKVGSKALPNSVAGADSLNWHGLAQCESGGNPKAVNPAGPYYGLYQFMSSTWHSLGGSGIPTNASASEQTYRAKLLYKRSGWRQWPVCGKKLFT